MPKKRTVTPEKKTTASAIDIEAFGNRADKANSSISRTTVSLPSDLLASVEDLATANKRSRDELRTVSAIVKRALEEYITSHV